MPVRKLIRIATISLAGNLFPVLEHITKMALVVSRWRQKKWPPDTAKHPAPSLAKGLDPVRGVFFVFSFDRFGQIDVVSDDLPAERGTAFAFEFPVVGGDH